jgi:dihydrodipicolinate synthase/N-acetylneuraminate lyase
MKTALHLTEGVVTALGTPLDENENLHEEGMRLQIRMQLAAGVNALLVLGSMGAMQLLKDQTCEEALRVTLDEVGGVVPVIVGCGDTGTERTLKRIRLAEKYSMSGIALVPPYFYRFTDAELLRYFQELAGRTDLPVYLYDNPAWTKHALGYDLIVELSKTPNIVGLKESGDLATLRACAEHFRDSQSFRVFSGATLFLDVSLQLGARGIIEGLFAVAPEYGVAIWQDFQSGDFAASRGTQDKLIRLVNIVKADSTFAGFTAAMNLRGVPGNFAVRPFAQCTSEGRQRVRAILEKLGLLAEERRNAAI